jgi:hypothetical protein
MCQSCGMPLSKDPENGGTNADGSRSAEYCSYCYKDGAFVGGEVDVKEFQKICRKAMREHNIPAPLAWLMTLGIPGLKRWRKS